MPERLIAGRYELLRELGSDSRGTVYLARDAQSGATLNLEVIHPHLTKDPEFLRRFEREARAAMGLQSPHIARIVEYGQDGDWHFVVTEHVQGQTLADLLRERGRLPADEALSIIAQVAEALHVGHQNGAAHGDVRPENVIITRDGTAKVSDFGIARALWDAAKSQRSLFRAAPDYAAPELQRGEADIRSDIYSLGVVLYEMVLGKLPFEADSPMAVMRLHAEAEPPFTGLAALAGVETILKRCLAKEPRARFQDPAELRQAVLQQAGGGQPSHGEGPSGVASLRSSWARRRRRRWMYGALALAGLALAAAAAAAVLLIPAGSSEPASISGPPWWDDSFAFRQPMDVAAGPDTVPSDYSVSLTFAHADLVADGKSQANGDDVRLLYWTGSDWTELDRVLERGSSWNSTSTEVWFKLQAGIGANSSSGDYYLYYGSPLTTDPPADESGVFLFADFFDRGDSDDLGRGWTTYESTADIDIADGALLFNLTSRLDNRPLADHTFAPVDDGLVWRLGFNWAGSPGERAYRVQMQLGDSANMANPPRQADFFSNVGVGPSLLWGGLDQGMTDHGGLGYEREGTVTEADVVSGPADIEVVVDVSAGSYDLYVDDVLSASAVPFSSAQTTIDQMRLFTSKTRHVDFDTRQFDYTYVRRHVDSEPAATLAPEQVKP